MHKNWFLIGLLAVSGIAIAQEAYTLSANGYGPVKIGMTVAEASKALGVKLVTDDEVNNDYYYVHPAKGNREKIAHFMVQQHRITRVKTDSGIKVGDSEQRVHQVYGKKIRVSQHEYSDKGDHYLTYWQTTKPKRGIRFETMSGKVMDIQGGNESIELIEGCS